MHKCAHVFTVNVFIYRYLSKRISRYAYIYIYICSNEQTK